MLSSLLTGSQVGVGGRNTVKNDGGTQMLVALTVKEMSYFVVGLSEDFVGSLSYL